MRVREGLLIAVAATLLASGSAVAQEPPTAELEPVAQVGAVSIPLVEFEHWFAQATRAELGRRVVFAPPRYDGCVTVKRRLRLARKWRSLPERELRRRCAQDHRALRGQTMQFLIQGQWVQQEAAAQGIEVTDRRVDRIFRRQRAQAFPERGGYERFLRETGADEQGVKYRIRLDTLQDEITRRPAAKARPVTADDVARYRAAHPKRFAGMGPAKAKRRARELLASERQQRTLASFIARFQRHYRSITWCAEEYEIAECGAPAPPRSSPERLV